MSTASGINVAIIGVGLVGSSVISQLTSVSTLSSRLHIVALQNSKKTLLSTASSPLSFSSSSDWKALLSNSPTSALALPDLVLELQKITKDTGRHTAVVDNTSDEKVAAFYPEFLRAGLSVVTPNKKAFSGPIELYNAIVERKSNDKAGSSGPLVYQESTVGAGLPIISTLNDLVGTGDQITKIEGVFSGTLSYIFNEFSTPTGGNKKFSEIVKFAKENGYTEPHPNDDLSGSDVARKLAILSRLIPELKQALPKGYLSVPTHSLTPAPLADVASGEEYVERLPEFDADYHGLNKEAFDQGCVLRYVGVIDVQKGEIKASLETYDKAHPFASSLSGSDNIVAFHTKRYSQRPLLVQGAGAGAEVTAMGVVADLTKIAERRG
ncbi:probable HOM6 - homoserine dehydrogenase [Melanopsichium pennsylvanicum]|uniref:Homoserine dehydrogenase n=2 Tax=Melanopsichium pennsylvanicum TaxID=63383 RepID=A0AAJ4XIT2_9BASI|nr:probable HOM6-homoserine dehydrogenase [Melanopsichium pennsylvanicum 4]SNX83167.1 probable HOM6 - homoserine dehydrogenase [Melanopsichium pennsylvanicum]